MDKDILVSQWLAEHTGWDFLNANWFGWVYVILIIIFAVILMGLIKIWWINKDG